MPRSVHVMLALLLALSCALGACAGGQRPGSGQRTAGASVRFVGTPRWTLVGLRVAVAYEIRYLNARPGRLPLSGELARLAPGSRELVVEADVKTSPGGELVKLRRAWTVQVPGSEPSVVTITVKRGALALKAQGARLGPPRALTPPACATLNPDLTSCDGAADPPAKALCVIRAVRARARQKLNPGWMGCANHQGNRLRTARQLHGHAAARGDTAARDALFSRSAQLEAQARACVKQYFLCD